MEEARITQEEGGAQVVELICWTIRTLGQLLCDCGQVIHLSELQTPWGYHQDK